MPLVSYEDEADKRFGADLKKFKDRAQEIATKYWLQAESETGCYLEALYVGFNGGGNLKIKWIERVESDPALEQMHKELQAIYLYETDLVQAWQAWLLAQGFVIFKPSYHELIEATRK